MFKLKDGIFAIPFPDTCIVCGKPVETKDYACNKCKNKIPLIDYSFKCKTCLSFLHSEKDGICGACLSEKPRYSRLISCVKYEAEVKKSLQAYKFRNRPDFHTGFSKLACEVLERDGGYFDAIVPMPLSKKSLKERGYNQSALIAKKISEYFSVDYFDDVLIKIKETKKQSDLKLSDRKKNVKGVFSVCAEDELQGKHILLVDDIFTTGSTMREAAKTLSPFISEITAFTIARAYLK